ncbi:MAG: molecular chaperone GrpE [Bryobacterales bacterium]|jgi:molecular chaperone GrpE|nr:molecular chaperone GrpE [Bryobacterales bacterium]
MEPVESMNTITPEEPGDERDRLKADLGREHDLYLRALADFDNYRRRVQRDRATSAASARRDIILPLLEVLDGFDRALPYLSTAPEPVAEGVQAIQRRLLDLLGAQEVTSFKAVGEPFDPAAHEAIDAVDSTDYDSGIVTDEVQRGYRMGGELLRPARVRVAR